MREDDIDEGIAHYRDSPRFSEAEKLALLYSELMALNPGAIDAAFYADLRRHYSEAEIVEQDQQHIRAAGSGARERSPMVVVGHGGGLYGTRHKSPAHRRAG